MENVGALPTAGVSPKPSCRGIPSESSHKAVWATMGGAEDTGLDQRSGEQPLIDYCFAFISNAPFPPWNPGLDTQSSQAAFH